jgi:hypothetical protein
VATLTAAVKAAVRAILLSIKNFSRVVVQIPLRDYQVGPANAVIDSCLKGEGLEILWIFPRQSGKDEAISQLCAFLLTLFHRVEASIVHVYPTGGQLSTGATRLERRLENLWTGGRWWQRTKPLRRGVGLAQVTFLSGHPQAKAEGATASLLLIVNELQDQNVVVIGRRFEPMRASTNATSLYVGTVRTTGDLLWQKKTQLERLEQQDGIKRVFVVSPGDVALANPAYGRFVDSQVAQKGRQHPVIKTELFNEPVDVAAGLFPDRRRAMMLGSHSRLRSPVGGEYYLAVIDVGGQDEAATEEGGLTNPGRDYTVTTIVRLSRQAGLVGPLFEAVDVMVDQGTRHFQDSAGRPSLFNKTLGYLRHWGVNAVICDQTGVGQGFTDALKAAYKRPVFGFSFTLQTKARLGNDFLAVIETGRFKHFKDGYETAGSDAWWFFTQAEFCGYELSEGMSIEKGLRWGVAPSARTTVEDVVTVAVHDDRLVSAALVAEADRLIREGALFLSTGESVVIRRNRVEDIDAGASWS